MTSFCNAAGKIFPHFFYYSILNFMSSFTVIIEDFLFRNQKMVIRMGKE